MACTYAVTYIVLQLAATINNNEVNRQCRNEIVGPLDLVDY